MASSYYGLAMVFLLLAYAVREYRGARYFRRAFRSGLAELQDFLAFLWESEATFLSLAFGMVLNFSWALRYGNGDLDSVVHAVAGLCAISFITFARIGYIAGKYVEYDDEYERDEDMYEMMKLIEEQDRTIATLKHREVLGKDLESVTWQIMNLSTSE